MVCKVGDREELFISNGPFSGVESALTNWLSRHERELDDGLSSDNRRIET
jgi:hypothetical protein